MDPAKPANRGEKFSSMFTCAVVFEPWPSLQALDAHASSNEAYSQVVSLL